VLSGWLAVVSVEKFADCALITTQDQLHKVCACALHVNPVNPFLLICCQYAAFVTLLPQQTFIMQHVANASPVYAVTILSICLSVCLST